MAKKLNKLMQRVAALEKAVADFFAAPKKKAKRKIKKVKAKPVKVPAKKAKATKAVSRPRPAAVAKKRKAAKRPAVRKAASPAPVKKTARKVKRIAPPTPEQLVPSGAPDFTT